MRLLAILGAALMLSGCARFAFTQKARVSTTKWDNDQYDAFITACDE
jgi:hypothetical protein